MRTSIETVTPESAKKILGNNLETNRNVRKSTVDKYASDMSSGRWTLTGSSIQISDEGKLIDGQHRLFAVIKSGIPQEFVVARDVMPAAFDHIDLGLPRNVSDILATRGRYAKNQHIGAVRYVHFGFRAGRDGVVSLLKIADLCEEHVDRVKRFGPAANIRGVSVAPVFGALALASFYESPDDVLAFAAILTSGISAAPRDHTVIAIRNVLLTNGSSSSNAGAASSELFLKTCRAIQAFCAGLSLTKIYAPKVMDDIYAPRGSDQMRRVGGILTEKQKSEILVR